jgi:hypothetical protein
MADEESWEARMAARTKARREQRELEAGVTDEETTAQFRTTHPWMNGWSRLSLTAMLIGSGVHCVACGRLQGVTCVAITPNWTPPDKDPDWPFGQDNCPVCQDKEV